MYKSKDESNKAAAERMKKHRSKGVTEGVTLEGVTPLKESKHVTPKEDGFTVTFTGDSGGLKVGLEKHLPPIILSDGQIWHPDPTMRVIEKPQDARTAKKRGGVVV